MAKIYKHPKLKEIEERALYRLGYITAMRNINDWRYLNYVIREMKQICFRMQRLP